MKKPFLIYLFLIHSLASIYSQTINCVLENDSIAFSDSVRVIIENKDSNDIYVSIALEMQRLNEEWILYSRDVMTTPFSKLSVQIRVESQTERTITFLIQAPEFFEIINGMIMHAQKKELKMELLRLKVSYGYYPDNLNKFIYLPFLRT
jgi:hypothetical protein